jgi:hypothetical protein
MGDPSPSGKTYKFSLLPPSLQLQLWVLGLSADTSRVGIAFQPNQFITGLNYNYGGAITASRAATMGGTVTLGFDPSKTEGSLVYKGYDFSVSATGSPSQEGLSLSYGKALLPTPDELQTTFDHAWTGFAHVWRDRGAAPSNPLVFVQAHGKDIAAVTQAANAVQRINALDPKSSNFGATLTFTDAPINTSFPSGPRDRTVMIKVGWSF